jgi:hypothetical protein
MMEKWRKMGNTKYNGEKMPEKLVGWVEGRNPTHFGSTELELLDLKSKQPKARFGKGLIIV